MDGSALVTVNLDEMCRIIGVSAPTFRGWLKRYQDFPVVTEGGRGREWEFDPHAVNQWRKTKLEEESSAASAKLELVKQRKLPGVEDDVAPAILSPAQQYQMIRARREQRRLDLEAGLLIEVAPLRSKLIDLFAAIPPTLRNVVADSARRNALPEDIKRALIIAIDERWGEAVQAFMAGLVPESDR